MIVTREQHAARKAEAFRAVCKLFGITDVHLLSAAEPFRMDRDPDSIEALRRLICDVRPDVIITHRRYLDLRRGLPDATRDSRHEVGFAAREAMYYASTPNRQTQQRPHTVAAVYYLSGGFCQTNEIDFDVDASDWHETLVAAEKLFQSQSPDETLARRRVEGEAGAAGWSARTRFAEGFIRNGHELYDALPVSPNALQRAAEPSMNWLKRLSGTLDSGGAPSGDDRRLSIMVVVAHPHDFTHCAATCGIHRQRGDDVTVVCLTDGSRKHHEKLHDELMKPKDQQDPAIVDESVDRYAARKADEFRSVAAVFNVTNVRILSMPEPFRMERAHESFEQLADIICEVRPQVVIMQRPYLRIERGLPSGSRNEHDEAAFATDEAMLLAGRPDYETRRRPHRVAQVYYLGPFFERNEMDFYVDITDWADRRVEAEALFTTQGHSLEFSRKRIEISAGVYGWSSGVGYAEGFVRGRVEVFDHLPVNPRALQRAAEPRMALLDRMAGRK